MGLSQSRETVTESQEEVIKIGDLHERFGIELPEESIKDYLEQTIPLQKAREMVEETVEQQLDTLKDLLGLRTEVDTTRVEQEAEQVRTATEAGDIDSQESVERMGDLTDRVESATGVSGLGEAVDQVRERGEEVMESASFMSRLQEWAKAGGILGFFAGLILGIVKLFGYGETVEEATDTVKEQLSEERVNEVREEIRAPLLKLSEGLEKAIPEHPIIDANIEAALNDPEIFSEEDIIKIEERIRNGEEVNMNMLRSVLTGDKLERLTNTIFNEEAKEALKLKAEEDIVSYISEEYNLNLNSEKREELTELVREHSGNINFLQVADRFATGETIHGYDILGATLGTGIDMAKFSILLVTKGIIGTGDIIINLKDTASNTLEIGLSALGLSSDITFEKFREELSKMSSSEKGLLLGVMYRKTGLFVQIISKAGEIISRGLTELVTPTTVSSFKMLLDSGLGNINNQIESFQKISSAISGTQLRDPNLDTISNQIKTLGTNGEIIKILDEGGDIVEIKAKIVALQNIDGIDKDLINAVKSIDISSGDMNKFRQSISNLIQFEPVKVNVGNSIRRLFPGVNQSISDISRNIQQINSYQKAKIVGGGAWNALYRTFAKHKEIIASLGLSRKGDRLVFESLSSASAHTKMSALRQFANSVPEDVFRNIFGGITEIAFIGLSLGTKQDNESFGRVLLENMLYMSGIIGPIALTLNVGSYLDENTGEVQWVNVAQSSAGVVLLGIDTATAISIFGTHGLTTDAFKKIGLNVIVRPITNTGRAIVSTGRLVRNMIDITRGRGEVNFRELLSKTRGRGKTALILGALALGGYAIMELTTTDIDDEFKELVDNGVIDEGGQILKPDEVKRYFREELSDSEKESFIEMIYITQEGIFGTEPLVETTGNLNFEVDNNNLYIRTESEYIGEWVTSEEMRSYLTTLGVENITFNNGTSA